MQTTNDGERLTEVMADSKRVADIHAALETSLQIQGVELQLDLIWFNFLNQKTFTYILPNGPILQRAFVDDMKYAVISGWSAEGIHQRNITKASKGLETNAFHIVNSKQLCCSKNWVKIVLCCHNNDVVSLKKKKVNVMAKSRLWESGDKAQNTNYRVTHQSLLCTVIGEEYWVDVPVGK